MRIKKNINGFRLNKNGKPLTTSIGEVKFKEYQGAMFRKDGNYYFYLRFFGGFHIYST